MFDKKNKENKENKEGEKKDTYSFKRILSRSIDLGCTSKVLTKENQPKIQLSPSKKFEKQHFLSRIMQFDFWTSRNGDLRKTPQDIIKFAGAALLQYPNLVGAFALQCIGYYFNGEYLQALIRFHRIPGGNDNDICVRHAKIVAGCCFFEIKNYKIALDYLSHLDAIISPVIKHHALFCRGLCYLKLNQLAKAKSDFIKLQKLLPKDQDLTKVYYFHQPLFKQINQLDQLIKQCDFLQLTSPKPTRLKKLSNTLQRWTGAVDLASKKNRKNLRDCFDNAKKRYKKCEFKAVLSLANELQKAKRKSGLWKLGELPNVACLVYLANYFLMQKIGNEEQIKKYSALCSCKNYNEVSEHAQLIFACRRGKFGQYQHVISMLSEVKMKIECDVDKLVWANVLFWRGRSYFELAQRIKHDNQKQAYDLYDKSVKDFANLGNFLRFNDKLLTDKLNPSMLAQFKQFSIYAALSYYHMGGEYWWRNQKNYANAKDKLIHAYNFMHYLGEIKKSPNPKNKILDHFAKVMRKYPEVVDIIICLAEILQQEGEKEKAKLAYRMASVIFEKLQDKENAERMSRKAGDFGNEKLRKQLLLKYRFFERQIIELAKEKLQVEQQINQELDINMSGNVEDLEKRVKITLNAIRKFHQDRKNIENILFGLGDILKISFSPKDDKMQFFKRVEENVVFEQKQLMAANQGVQEIAESAGIEDNTGDIFKTVGLIKQRIDLLKKQSMENSESKRQDKGNVVGAKVPEEKFTAAEKKRMQQKIENLQGQVDFKESWNRFFENQRILGATLTDDKRSGKGGDSYKTELTRTV